MIGERVLEVWRNVLDLIWRPRTEIGRTIKHKLKYGLFAKPPAQRRYRRRW